MQPFPEYWPKPKYFLPDFEPYPEFKKGSSKAIKADNAHIASQRQVLAVHNLGNFYAAMYHGIYNHALLRSFKGDAEKLLSGEKRNYHPDIQRKLYVDNKLAGIYETEVKTFQKRDRAILPSNQAENYAYYFLDRMQAGLEQSGFDYVFMRYIPKFSDARYKEKGTKKTKYNYLPSHELVEHLAQDTESMTIIPSNLFFFLWRTAKKRMMDQTTSKAYDEVTQKRLKTSQHSLLAQGTTDWGLLSDAHTPELTDILQLDNITVEQYMAPTTLYCAHERDLFLVKPFPITHYKLQDPQEWNWHFFLNHKSILSQVGIRNLFAEGIDPKKEEERKEEYQRQLEAKRREQDDDDVPF